jgi:hypothetical protein
MRFSTLSAFAVSLLVGMSSPVTAQDKEALAEALYKSALDLMEQGKDSEACPKLKQSQEIDPAVGTLLYLGLCYERIGKPASAWATYRAAGEASRKANQPERRDIAMERAAKIEPTLSTLTLLLPREAHVPGIEIFLDGSPVGTASVGVPMPVDPGPHRIEISAPGHVAMTEDVLVEPNGATHTVNLRALEAQDRPKTVDSSAPTADSKSVETGRPSTSTQKTIGLVVGGVGLAGLAAGTYFGLHMRSKENEAKDKCDNYPTNCSPAGLSANEDASTAAGYATAGFIVGGAALIGGIVLYTTAPNQEPGVVASLRIDPRLATDGGGLSVGGRW